MRGVIRESVYVGVLQKYLVTELNKSDYFKELIVSSGDLEYSNEIHLEKVVSPNGWSLYDPYDYWVQNYDELIDLHNQQI